MQLRANEMRGFATARSVSAAIAALASLAAGGGLGCSKTQGELMLVVQTDMDMPKDIDRIRIEVLSTGIPRYTETHENLGDASSLLLPATLGIVASDSDPTLPV